MSDETFGVREEQEERDDQISGVVVSDNFGHLLKHYREKVKNYTLAQLQDRCSVSASYLSRIEKGIKKNVSISVLLKISEALDIPYSILLATSFQEKPFKVATLSELLIRHDFSVNNQLLMGDKKELLIKINEFIAECEFGEKTKIKDLCIIAEMVEQFKTAG